MAQPGVEIIAIGNELLLGQVQETNSHWLAQKIRARGGRLRRVAVVGDEPQAIIDELHAGLSRRPILLVTTGGLGPTADDLTLAAVAEALERPLELNSDARGMVEARYQHLAEIAFVTETTLTPAREKMAYLPQGATPLANSVGTAPGSLLRLGSTTVVSLPGVPGEMMAIWEESLSKALDEIFGSGVYEERTIVVHTRDESSLAPFLKEVAERHPQVYIKSRARVFDREVRIRITLSSSGAQDEVRTHIEKALQELRGALARGQIAIEEGSSSES